MNTVPTGTSAPPATNRVTEGLRASQAFPVRTRKSESNLTDINVTLWARLLEGYEDKEFVVAGLTSGFGLGYQGNEECTEARNARSVALNPGAAKAKIDAELSLGRLAGPFPAPPFGSFKCSPLSLREKSTPGRYRLLHDLSFPYNEHSVNGNIPDEWAKVSYSTVKDAVDVIISLPSAVVAKADLKDAYRQIPISPDSYWLVCFSLEGSFYYDRRLPMGARSSCFIFERLTDSLVFILKNTFKVKHVVKLLDDFLFIGESFPECEAALNAFELLCEKLRLPLAKEKTIRPCTQVTFLGVELDTQKNEARLPLDKLTAYAGEARVMRSRQSCSQRELKSLIGRLQFATCIIQGGRCFLRRLHDQLFGPYKPNKRVWISSSMKEDLRVWETFLRNYNGRALLSYSARNVPASISISTDASLKGYGGHWGAKFVIGEFPANWKHLGIEALEMYAVLATFGAFAKSLRDRVVLLHCDNEALVHCLNKLTSKNKNVMSFLRPFVILLMSNNISLRCIHIRSEDNSVSDSLSRLQIARSRILLPTLARSPTRVPDALLPKNWIGSSPH